MPTKTNFAQLNRWITLYDDLSNEIEQVWAKVDYHKDYQIQKTNILFTVRSRTDIVPTYVVQWGVDQYTVHNVAQVSLDYTVLECALPAGLKPPE